MRFLFAAALVFCVAGPVWPQQESRQDRGKRVVDEAVQALGGDAFRTL
jgi:hypothetical protein